MASGRSPLEKISSTEIDNTSRIWLWVISGKLPSQGSQGASEVFTEAHAGVCGVDEHIHDSVAYHVLVHYVIEDCAYDGCAGGHPGDLCCVHAAAKYGAHESAGRIGSVDWVVDAVEVGVEGEGLLEFAEDGVAGGEEGEGGVVLAGAEVVLADGLVEALAGELEGIGDGFGGLGGEGAADGVVGVGVFDGGVGGEDEAGDGGNLLFVKSCYIVPRQCLGLPSQGRWARGGKGAGEVVGGGGVVWVGYHKEGLFDRVFGRLQRVGDRLYCLRRSAGRRADGGTRRNHIGRRCCRLSRSGHVSRHGVVILWTTNICMG